MMTTFLIVLWAALVCFGYGKNIQSGDDFNVESPYLLTLINGIAWTMIFWGLALGAHSVALAGLIVSAVCCAPFLFTTLRIRKNAVKAQATKKELFSLSVPVAIFRMVYYGLGKLFRLILLWTLIGIPLNRMMENMFSSVEALSEYEKYKAMKNVAEDEEEKANNEAKTYGFMKETVAEELRAIDEEDM